MSKENALVDYTELLKQRRQALAAQTTAGDSNFIRMKPGKFIHPNGDTGTELKVVILGFVSGNFFYDRPFDPDNIFAPACWAIGPLPNELKPGDNVPIKQNDDCATCSLNVFGSASNGKGKACANRRQLAVVAADAPDGEIFLLSVPPTSLKYFDKYARSVAAQYNLDLAQVVTHVTHDPNSDWVAPRFKVDGVIDGDSPFLRRLEEAQKILQETEPDPDTYVPLNKK